jgi:hypothetical protein
LQDNQRDLEAAIELLSAHLEKNMKTQEEMIELKQTIQHQCTLVDRLVELISELAQVRGDVS